MAKISVNISLDPELKKEATRLFKSMGLDFSTAITLFLKQSLLKKKIPFEITSDLYNEDTKDALREVEEMKKHPELYKTYSSAKELEEDCLKDDSEEND